jgi:hypothetical protein
MAEAPRDAAVRHRDCHLLQRFRHQCPEIPVSVGAAHPGAWVAFDRVVEIGKAQRIAVAEDRRIVADHVPVAVLVAHDPCSAMTHTGAGTLASVQRRFRSQRYIPMSRRARN